VFATVCGKRGCGFALRGPSRLDIMDEIEPHPISR
jgi:hypothetical protein